MAVVAAMLQQCYKARFEGSGSVNVVQVLYNVVLLYNTVGYTK